LFTILMLLWKLANGASNCDNMKFYAEIRHPTEQKVLWHYFLEARDKQAA